MDSSQALSDYLNLSAKTSTFVSVDVAGSTALKAGENEQDVIYTFLAYHKMVSDLAYQFHGEVISISGDGMMCRFQRAEDALGLTADLLTQLPLFNKQRNRLTRPLALRVGVHTGEVLENESLASGQIISRTIDLAAKLQQSAPPGHARLSEATIQSVKEGTLRSQRVGWDAALQTNVFEYSPASESAPPRRPLPSIARILIVEQELDEVQKLRKTFFSRHHETLVVFTQNQAALAVAAWKPHLIVLSTDLPWETGWELLVGLRADKSVSDIPIISMSRQSTGEIVQKSFRLGANGYLRKPLDEQQVLKRAEMVFREFY